MNKYLATVAVVLAAALAVVSFRTMGRDAHRGQTPTATPLPIFLPAPTNEAYFPSWGDEEYYQYMSSTEWMTLPLACETIVDRLTLANASSEPIEMVEARHVFPIDGEMLGVQPRLIVNGDLPDIALLLRGSFSAGGLGMPGHGRDGATGPFEYVLVVFDRVTGLYGVKVAPLDELVGKLPPERSRAEEEELMLPGNWGIDFPE